MFNHVASYGYLLHSIQNRLSDVVGPGFVCFVGLFHIGNWNFWLVMA